mgnify:CR=1 FL=1
MNQKYFWSIIPIITFLFLNELILDGKIPLASDMVAHEPIKKWIESTSDFPHWFPNLFSGMPSYGGYIYTPGHPLKIILDFLFFNTGVKLWFFLSIGGLGLFFFLRFLKISNYSSIFAGIAYALTPYVFGLISAGHNNKIMAGGFIPWVVFSAIYMFKYPSIKSLLFLSIASALQLWTNHPQIFYYTWMVIGLWWFLDLIFSIIKKESKVKGKFNNLGLIILSLVISLLMVSDPYYEVYTFQKESNRGSPSVLDDTNDTKKGTKWDYATQWSFHPSESISFILPYYYGLQNFSVKDRSDPEKFMKQASYWGYMPFTQSTHYLGLLVIIISFFSLWCCFVKKDFGRTELYLWIIAIAVLITGFGIHFSILYKPLFKLAPFFSKFRVPSMIYMMLSLLLPMIAAIGLDKITHKNNKNTLFNDAVKIFGIFIALCFILLLIGESLVSFSSPGDVRFTQYVEIVKNIRIDLFNKGAILALLISSAALFFIWLYSNNRLSEQILLIILIGILVTDLWIINNEFLSLKSSKSMGNQFIQTQDIKFINNDKSKFRVFPADEINSNKFGYWNIESVGGYRAVKLRNYQDLMDIGGFRRPEVLNMLNVKYLITRKKVKNTSFKQVFGINNLYENLDVLPRAWFVNNIKNVTDQEQSLSRVMDISFKPKNTAVIVNYDGPELTSNSDGNIEIQSFSPNLISLQAETKGGALLVLSEIFYNSGWKCRVDDQLVPIYQTNHILRSVFIPDGSHTVEFYYDSSDWKMAKVISRFSFFSSIIFLGVIFYRENKLKIS